MDKDYTKEQYYIVSLDNGIRKEEPVTIEVFNSFKDGSKLVQLNNMVFGVLNSNSLKPETMYIDDYVIIKSDIAELFDIDHEDARRLVTEDKNVGIFTTLNYSKDIETRISGTAAINTIVNAINAKNVDSEEAVWVDKIFKYPTGSKESCIKDHEQIADIIDLGIYSLNKTIELQMGSPIDSRLGKAIRKNYLRMILFDYIIGKKYRGFDYYLISKVNDNGKPVWMDAYFAPISISNNLNKEELIGDNEYVLNNKYIDREALLAVLFEKYQKDINKLAQAIADAKKLYVDAIGRIIYNNTDLQYANSLEAMILANLNRVAKSFEDAEAKKDKGQRTNKVERTMATQSLNVRVTTKLDLIQKKYPINPKDHKDVIKANKKKEADDIKLTIESEKDSGGFTIASILISVVGLICGIAIGVAYIILKMGS